MPISIPTNNSKRIHFRSLSPLEEEDCDKYSPHFLAALQLLAHTVSPLRKVLVHFSLTCQKKPKEVNEKREWQLLQALGLILKELIAEAPATAADDKDDQEEDANVPVDPTSFYKALVPCLEHLKKSLKPRDATEALQILLESIQESCLTVPVTNSLWSSLLDDAGLGIVARQSIVGKCVMENDQILQRTAKESCMEWCPLILKDWKSGSIEKALQAHVAKQPYSYDFDEEGFDFEVRIPVLSPAQSKGLDSSTWKTTRTLQWTSVTSYLFLGIDRWTKDGAASSSTETNAGQAQHHEGFDASEVKIPQTLNISSICDSRCIKDSGGKEKLEYELVAGILHDDTNYVAIVKNDAIDDPSSEEAWKLLESEEVIGMSQQDVLEFLPGDGDDGAPCGTLLVYRKCDAESHKKLNGLLSDIIISQVRGSLQTKDYYYEEEVIG